uniref:Uncharacterized protein n=1 Tax=Ditylenchus dipsaci TaxID=166011 RepID=A0A915CXS7_9BILA
MKEVIGWNNARLAATQSITVHIEGNKERRCERWLVTEVHEEAQFHFTSRYHGLPKTASRLRFEDHPVHQVREQDEGEEQL